jgi:hypothetical protein
MTKAQAVKLAFTVFALVALAIAPASLFGQRGGGHSGGGFHGGGGSRGGGFSGSAGRSYSGGPSAAGSYRAAPGPSYSRGSSSYGRAENSYRSSSSGNSYRAPAGNTGAASARGGMSGGAGSHAAIADGQWHTFGSPSPVHSSGSPGVTNAGTGRTFVGQGHQLYEESPRRGADSAATQPRAVANVKGTSVTPASTASRSMVAGNTFSGLRTFASTGVANSTRVGTTARLGVFGLGPNLPLVRPGFGFGFGFGFPVLRPRFGFGFDLGFGFGFGWSPCWGAAWAWDPFCFGAFAGPPYGYYAYPPYDPDDYPPPTVGPYPNNGPNDGPNDGPADESGQPPAQSSAPSEPVNPNWDTTANAANAANPANSQGPVVIYLKDGNSFSPSDYWIADDQLHYVLDGSENSVAMDHVDLRRTNDENAKHGVKFWLKSEPRERPAPSDEAPAAAPAPSSDDNAAPDAAPAPADEPDSKPPATVKLTNQSTA